MTFKNYYRCQIQRKVHLNHQKNYSSEKSESPYIQTLTKALIGCSSNYFILDNKTYLGSKYEPEITLIKDSFLIAYEGYILYE